MHHMLHRPMNKLSFSILRVPFFLEPHYPENKSHVGTNRDRLIQKWGGVQGWEDQKKRHNLKGRGEAAGIPHFNLDRLTGNTMASHRLIQYVGKMYGLKASESLYDRLNKFYFVEGHSLNDKPRLAKVASEQLQKILLQSKNLKSSINHLPPLNEQEISNFLETNNITGRKEIEEALDMLHRLGIHSIPKFIVEGATLVDGAADWKVFVDVFHEIEERRAKEKNVLQRSGPEPVFGKILGIDSNMLLEGSFRTVEDLDVFTAL